MLGLCRPLAISGFISSFHHTSTMPLSLRPEVVATCLVPHGGFGRGGGSGRGPGLGGVRPARTGEFSSALAWTIHFLPLDRRALCSVLESPLRPDVLRGQGLGFARAVLALAAGLMRPHPISDPATNSVGRGGRRAGGCYPLLAAGFRLPRSVALLSRAIRRRPFAERSLASRRVCASYEIPSGLSHPLSSPAIMPMPCSRLASSGDPWCAVGGRNP